MRSGRTVLITGGAGFIGSHLADDALAHGERVVVLDNLSTGKRENVPAGAVFYERDLLDARARRAPRRRARRRSVNHHAAQANVRISLEDPAADAASTCSAAWRCSPRAEAHRGRASSSSPRAAARSTASRSSIPATRSIRSGRSSPYGVAKYAVELYLEAFRRSGDLDPIDPPLRQRLRPAPGTEGRGRDRRHPGREAPRRRDRAHLRRRRADARLRARRATSSPSTAPRWSAGSRAPTTSAPASRPRVNQLYRKVAAALGVSLPPRHVPPLLAEMRRNSARREPRRARPRRAPAHRRRRGAGAHSPLVPRAAPADERRARRFGIVRLAGALVGAAGAVRARRSTRSGRGSCSAGARRGARGAAVVGDRDRARPARAPRRRPDRDRARHADRPRRGDRGSDPDRARLRDPAPAPTCAAAAGWRTAAWWAPTSRSSARSSSPARKAPHLNYVGDSILGREVNLGAGTVLSNFRHDGGEIAIPTERTGGSPPAAASSARCWATASPPAATRCSTRARSSARAPRSTPGCSSAPASTPPTRVVKLRQQLEIAPLAPTAGD